MFPELRKFMLKLRFGKGDKSKVKEWIKLTSLTGGVQILIQAIGLLSGIIVIRLLSTEQYALYTLANTMLGTMVVLADGGISSGVMAEGGKVWRNKHDLGAVMQTGLDLRKKFAIGSLLIALPILIYLLLHHGASWVMAIVIIASIIPAFISSLTGSIFQLPLKLRQDIKPLQGNVLIESIGRFALIFSLFVSPWAFIALLGSGIPRIFANIRLRKLSNPYVNWRASPDIEIRKRILKLVSRLMPGAIYYVVSGQISIWLISIFGSTASVAEIGALGRISIMITVVGSVFGTLIYPRFARIEEVSRFLLKRYIQIQCLLVLICLFLVAGVWLFSNEILWVLGDEYRDLNSELVLLIIASSVSLISGGAYVMSTHRGWAIHPGLSIPINILSIIIGVLFLDVSTLIGVIIFMIFINSVQWALNNGYFIFSYSKNKLGNST